MRAEHRAESRVEQVRRRVIAAGRVADRRVHFGGDDVADAQYAGRHGDAVRARQTRANPRHTVDSRRCAGRFVDDSARVGDLAA